MIKGFIFFTVVIFMGFVSVQAQTAEGETSNTKEPAVTEDWTLKRGAKEIGVELGFAPTQPIFFSGHKEYDTSGRKLLNVTVNFGRVIGTKHGVTYEYLFGVTPVSFAFRNEVKNPAFVSAKDTPDTPETVRETTYSFAVQPAGFRFIFRPKKRLKPYAQADAGFIFSRNPVPIPQSPRYNFVGDFGGGLMYNVTKKQTLNIGYRYYHISNMNIGEINPGYNANLFTIGYSFFSK